MQYCTDALINVRKLSQLLSGALLPITLYHCHCIERQQLVADIERLTSDKADLLTRLQCYEEDLKTTNECEHLV